MAESGRFLGRIVGRFDSPKAQRAAAGAASAALHAVMFVLIVYSGGRHDGIDEGDTPITRLVMIEASEADRRDGVELTPIEPEVPAPDIQPQPDPSLEPPVSVVADELLADTAPEEIEQSELQTEAPALIEPPLAEAPTPPTIVMSQASQTAIEKELARVAEALTQAGETQAAWEQDGTQYSAVLKLQRANDGTSLDRVIAQVTASDRGRQLTTSIQLKRLAFSQFTQMVDRWDPMVQLHDDEIVGRFHSNGQFNLAYDSRTAPKFMGKVTTTARTFHTDSVGRRRDSEIFVGGLETRVSRIPLPEELAPFEWAPKEDDARVHELARDTRIRFYPDGGYTWRSRDVDATGYMKAPEDRPVYFIGAHGVTVSVQGVVRGKVLVYSPHRIVLEGNLTYASDPRKSFDSPDYLGIVCDRYIEVAPPGVTGPGDVEIQAAIFAGRRFVVTSINHPRPATLRIYGSLAAGSLSASEPRYATKIEYDDRFEQRRPPGFPSTNRFEVDGWDGSWKEVSERVADDAF